MAAAVLCFAFLPVAFSRLALTDVGALLPVALCLLCSVRLAETGRLAWCAWAGAAVGAAVGFKYTAGLVVLVPLAGLALAAAARRAPVRRLLAGGAVVLAAAVVAFFVTTPYFFLDVGEAVHQLRGQADVAGSETKLGQAGDSGPLYYLREPHVGVRLAGDRRRRRRRSAAGAPRPHAPGAAARLPGRPLPLPERAVPLLRALAAARLSDAGAAGGGRARARRRARARPRARARAAPRWPSPAAVVLYQPLAADSRSMAVLGHRDTREIARRWLVSTQPRGLRVVVEPAVPDRWFWPTRRGRPKRSADRPQLVNQLVRDTQEAHVQYTGTLRPELLDRYRAAGYCTVVTMDLIRGRVDADRRPAALAYYARLERESDLVFRGQPVPRGRAGAAVQLRPELQLLLAGLRAPRARGADLPAARLPPGRRPAERRVSAAAPPEPRAAERRASAPPGDRVGRRATALAVAVVLLVALALRLWNLDHGLPFAYNSDEAEHFVPRAIAMLHGSLDPGYYENPPALTYLLLVVFHLRGGDLARTSRPTPSRPSSRPASSSRCWARSASGSRSGPGRGSTTAASGSWPPRCSPSPSCRSSTPSTRSTTS